MMDPAHTTLRYLHERGRNALRAGDFQGALSALRLAARKTGARDDDYDRMLVDLREALLATRNVRGALSVDGYRGDERAERELFDRAPEIDRARTLRAWAERDPSHPEAPMRHARAAELYEHVGALAHAALCRERADEPAAARVLWSRLTQRLGALRDQAYAAGLASFNLARTCLLVGDRAAARPAVVTAVHLLEEAADHYERGGQRDRAFDCFDTLIAIGRHAGQFEHVLEGFVNATRILREDNMRYYAIERYEEALTAAQEQEELTAGATLAQEMSAYASTQGLEPVAAHAMLQAATLWQRVARAALARGAPAEVAENALLASVAQLARLRQFAQAGALYEALAELDLEPARRQHYERASRRYRGVVDASMEAAPLGAHLRQESPAPDVWLVDLLEWEQQGSASAACADIVLAPWRWPRETRRAALVGRLGALAVEQPGAREEQVLELVADLARVMLYELLSPLEHLYARGTPAVRRAVVTALERFTYKRSFVTVRSALADPDPAVRDAACRTVAELKFPHAFDALRRIFRESSASPVRAAALRAIARIDTTEAAELALDVLLHEGPAERAALVEALKETRNAAFLDVARRALPTLGGAVAATVRDLVRER
jgi:tetratricopeptide (TPR) repeat protein